MDIRKPGAIIFDMDGLLIDSEPLWTIAEREIYGELGLKLSDEQLAETMGFRVTEVISYWYDKYPWSDEAPDISEISDRLINRVIELINAEGEALPGVHTAIETIQKLNIPIAIASSSWIKIIDAVVAKLNIADEIDVIHSSEREAYGKPHPGVFLTTATKLNIPAAECIVFEDSPNGVIAAKAARMKCVAVPGPIINEAPEFNIADHKMKSLEDLSEQLLLSLS